MKFNFYGKEGKPEEEEVPDFYPELKNQRFSSMMKPQTPSFITKATMDRVKINNPQAEMP